MDHTSMIEYKLKWDDKKKCFNEKSHSWLNLIVEIMDSKYVNIKYNS